MADTKLKIATHGLLVFVGLVMLTIAWEYHRGSRIENAFSAVHVGATETEVRHLLGRPSWVEPCGKSQGNPAPNCTAYIYRGSYAPLIPAYYEVRLGGDGNVLSTYLYVSP